MKKLLAMFLLFCFFFCPDVSTQTIYELRKLTDKDWLGMTTQERLRALNISNNHARNQSFLGNFGRSSDLYPRWGYDYYEMEDRYENYAFRGFENYNIIEDRRQKWYYNQFGDRLTKMTRSARIWNEVFYDDGTSSVSGPSGYVNAMVGVDGIWVAKESTNDWAIAVIGAGAMRTKLTPLTLSQPGLSGMTIDFQSPNYTASIVNSVYIQQKENAVMLRGVQFRRKFGALMLGTTFSNLSAAQRNREKGTDLRGHVSNYSPTPLVYAVRIMDDSPQDGDGPIIHDVKLKVNGIYRPDIRPRIIGDDLRRELVTAVYNQSQRRYLQPTIQVLDLVLPFGHLSIDERMPKYLDYLYMNDYFNGWNSSIMTTNFDVDLGKKYYRMIDPAGKPLQVNGNEYIVYLFDLGSVTEKVTRVEAEITVENDYRIQIADINTKRKDGGHDAKGDNFLHYNATYWRTAAQADGNIKDGSNLRTVKVDFGYEVGNMMYGVDAHFNYHGFRIDAEYITNKHYYMFSDGVPGTGLPANPPRDISPRNGYRSSQTDQAYYIITRKDWSHFGFTGEFFKMGKFYRPSMNYYIPNEISSLAQLNNRNDTIRMSMIADNDDDDQYPDTSFDSRVMAYRMKSLMDPDGVFPGNDVDNDGLPDNEKDNNNIPDYHEPFMMFDIDPDEFVFGDDFNNNTIPDFREDDMKYDTPYDLDRAGYHAYLRFTPQRNVHVLLGSLRTEGVALDNRTYDDYVKVKVDYDIFTVGTIFAEYRYERIQDNIQDKFVVVPTKTSYVGTRQARLSSYTRYLYYDEVEYRNSRVNRLYLESRIRCIPSLTVENHIKYENNRQLEGTMYDRTFQPRDTITTMAMINKFVYTRQWGNWTFSPGLKFRFYKKSRSESTNPLDHYLMRIPLVFLKYRLSPSTNITLGIQGFRGFELLYRDYIQEHNNYRQKNMTIQIENRTTYFGFEVWGGFGFKKEEVIFDEKYRAFEEYTSSTLFIQMWLGY